MSEIVETADDAVGVEQSGSEVCAAPASNASHAAPHIPELPQQHQQHTQTHALPLTQSLDNPSDKPTELTETPPQLGERYEVLGLVGSGGMGTVWKVFDKELNETFAIKVLNPDLVADETANKRFQKEAKLASELTHANIAAIFGPGTDTHGRPYIIMRYVDGESLADILKREGKLSEERALDIFKQICEALSHSHMKGIVHRDIKPSNIIISKTESGGDLVQIVDFGIARYIYEEVTKTQALTKAVDIFGSPMYMSPEQFLGEEITAQSDIYSLGCVLYEMLTGTPPFTDENPVKLILKQISERVDLEKVHEKFRFMLDVCLAKEPYARYRSVDQLLGAISKINLSAIIADSSFSKMIPLLCFLTTLMVGPICNPSYYGYKLSPINSCGILIVWAGLLAVNHQQAARTKLNKQFEMSVLLAALSSLISALAWSGRYEDLSTLAAIGVATFAAWLSINEPALTFYEKLKTIQIRSLTKINQPSQFVKRAMITCNYSLLAIFCLLSIGPGFQLACTYDFKGISAFSTLTHYLALPGFLFVMLFIVTDILFVQRTIPSSLLHILKLAAITIGISLTTAFVGKAALSDCGLVNLCRQSTNHDFIPPNAQNLQIAKEAVNYKNNYYNSLARIKAAWSLSYQDHEDKTELTIANQIIDNPNLVAQRSLFDAYNLRIALHLKNKEFASVHNDVMSALSAYKMPHKKGPNSFMASLFSKGADYPLTDSDLANLASNALHANDREGAVAALTMTLSNRADLTHASIKDLEKLIAQITGPYGFRPIVSNSKLTPKASK
ncbi:MAG: protein kinase [Candidatus Obscuribacter sp.]|nr:protein kinase [Candidatus Obscuribacter sp.]